ncbi:MAG TPA: hypothetical protein VLA36_09880 [Longimicrobiales bacterium]|nr:hypothetical protein [Longimicrobiales bacterium]
MHAIQRLRRGRPTLLVLVLGVACGGDDPAQGPPGVWGTLELESSYPEAFAYLSGVREMADGRVLAADPTGQALMLLDLEAGTADTLGSQGEGPQEYRGPDEVLALPADSSLLVDLGNDRLVVIDPDGDFVDWTPMSRRRADGRARSTRPRAVDAAGFLYLEEAYPPDAGPPDSVRVVRTRRGEGATIPVASIWRPPPPPFGPQSKRPILTPSDDWSAGADGRVAVARANGFSVDWYLPDGRIVTGPRHEVEVFPVDQSEKDAEFATLMESAVFTLSVADGNGVQRVETRRGVPQGAGLGEDDFAWPETLPTLQTGGTRVTPWGDAWVTRRIPRDLEGRVEVFDHRGAWVGFIALPPTASVVGFGTTRDGDPAVYLVRSDEVGLKWLTRHRVKEGRGQS